MILWLLLKLTGQFLKIYNNKKVPTIPPILTNDKLCSDFEVKANYFNNFLAFQCTPLANSSKIPENQTYITNTELSSVIFEIKKLLLW